MKFNLALICLTLTMIFAQANKSIVYAQQTTKSKPVCTKVGNPTTSQPSECKEGLSTTGPGEPTGGGSLGITATCPLGNSYQISCGTAKNPIGGVCGHAGVGYGACTAPPYAVCPYSPALKASIDVVLPSGNAAGSPVYLPYINGNESTNWTLIQGPVAIAGGAWGFKGIYATSINNKRIVLDLTHIEAAMKSTGSSGEVVGKVYSGTDGPGRGHLHTAISIEGVWVEPKDALMCSY